MSLLELAIGQEATIARVEITGAEGSLLRAMGVVEGLGVRVLRRAPFGGPLQIRVGEAAFALGRALAEQVKVTLPRPSDPQGAR
jgi:DtxR family Mn-dependent transcriptional regulator